MTKIKCICIVLVFVFAFSGPVSASMDPFSVKSALGSPPSSKSCLISVTAGELLEFDAADLERRMGLASGSLTGITVTSLPSTERGGLFLDGVEVEAYDFLDRASINRLCFAASEASGNATVRLLPQNRDGVATNLLIRILPTANRAPVLEGSTLTTAQNVAVSGWFQAQDPDGDSVAIQLISPPQKGEVRLQGLAFTYEPYHDRTGRDSFTVCAVDANGAYSDEAEVGVEIQKHTRDFFYSDMLANPSQYAALMLHDAGVYTGKRVGGSNFFEPGEWMNRGQFLMLLINASGLADTMTPTVNTGLPNDAELPSWIKRYVKKAIEEKILSPDLPFSCYTAPTRAEAVVLTDRASKIGDVKDYPLTMRDAGNLPSWALDSYRNLSAYRMLDLYDGQAHPSDALTNAYAADLAWQLYKHTHR